MTISWNKVTELPAQLLPNAFYYLKLDNGHFKEYLTDQNGNLFESASGLQEIENHIADYNNPHAVTAAQVGLGSVDNTSDANKPVSTAQASADAAVASAAASALASHAGASDPHSQYANSSRFASWLASAVGVSVQAYSATLDALAALTTTAFGRSLLTKADAAALRSAVALPTSTTAGRLARYTDAAGTQGQSQVSEAADGTLVPAGPIAWSGNTLPGGVAWNYAPPTTDAAAPVFRASFQDAQFSNGPAGNPNYWDHIAHFWWNGVGGDRVDPSQMGWGMSMESKFTNEGVIFGGEWHIQGIDRLGSFHRWLSVFAADGAAGSAVTTSADKITFRNDAGQSRITMDFAGSGAVVNLSNNTAFYIGTNNAPLAYQKNASGNFVALPYLDNLNRVAFSGGVYSVAAGADTEYGAANIMYVSTLAANKSLLYGGHGNSVTGNVYALNLWDMIASGKAIAAIGNNHATGHAILEARTEIGAGDPILSLNVNGGGAWSVGVDNSDSDKFKISSGPQRLGNGSEDRITIDTSGNVGIGTTSPTRQLELTASMALQNTTGSDVGVIYKGTNRFLHNFGAVTNTFLGALSGNFTMTGTANTAVGYSTLASLTSGSYNMAFGQSALSALTTGGDNVAMGNAALAQQTTGSGNVAIGGNSFFLGTGGSGNVGIGEYAGFQGGAANGTVAIGNQAGLAVTTSSYSTLIGRLAGYQVTTGGGNTLIGHQAGVGITTGTNNTIIGMATGLSPTLSNNIILADGSGNQRVNIDSTGNVGIGTTSPVCKADINGLVRKKTYATLALLSAAFAASLGKGMSGYVEDGEALALAGATAFGGGSTFREVVSNGTVYVYS